MLDDNDDSNLFDNNQNTNLSPPNGILNFIKSEKQEEGGEEGQGAELKDEIDEEEGEKDKTGDEDGDAKLHKKKKRKSEEGSGRVKKPVVACPHVEKPYYAKVYIYTSFLLLLIFALFLRAHFDM